MHWRAIQRKLTAAEGSAAAAVLGAEATFIFAVSAAAGALVPYSRVVLGYHTLDQVRFYCCGSAFGPRRAVLLGTGSVEGEVATLDSGLCFM